MVYNKTFQATSGVVFLTTFFVAFSAAAASRTDQYWLDRDGFPRAYAILTSDHIMYPDNITDWPIKIGAARQLFVDDYVISAMEHLTREFHQAEKYPGNPLMPGSPVAILYNEKTGLFRMWYNLHYAESRDGINWTKPDLGPGGNRVIPDHGEIRGFIYNPDIPKREGRYKIVLDVRYNQEANEPGGFYLYHSRDGIKWQRRPQWPVLQRTEHHMLSPIPEPKDIVEERRFLFQWTDPNHFQVNAMGDTSIFQYDPALKKYTCSAKFNLYMPNERFTDLGIIPDGKPRLRSRAFLESDDLLHWTSPRFLMFPDRFDAPDCQIYGHIGFPYESMWMGMVRIMHMIPAGFKQVDLQLAYSRDGRHWMRPLHREPFIPLGDRDSWEADYLGHTRFGPVAVGDELWFYYFGCRNADRDRVRHWSTSYIGLAKLRRDGFASLNADDQVGSILTRPLTFAGKKLFVNADVGKGGWVRASVLTRDMKPVRRYELTDSVALTEGTTKGRMVWEAGKELVPPKDDYVRLVFELKNAKLYSFWIE